jgi:hypothetical protein
MTAISAQAAILFSDNFDSVSSGPPSTAAFLHRATSTAQLGLQSPRIFSATMPVDSAPRALPTTSLRWISVQIT